MDLSTRVLGSSVARRLEDRASAVLLQIGRDTFTRADLADVRCFNFTAAATLSAILNRELAVKDTADVFHHVAPSALALPRLGAVAIAVLGAAFQAKGLGGARPLEQWVRAHTKREREIVTFATLKGQIERETTASAVKRRRRHGGPGQARRSNVRRFTARRKAS